LEIATPPFLEGAHTDKSAQYGSATVALVLLYPESDDANFAEVCGGLIFDVPSSKIRVEYPRMLTSSTEALLPAG
jgi:hypothetical protein